MSARDVEREAALIVRQMRDLSAVAQQSVVAVATLSASAAPTDKKGKKVSLQSVADALADLSDAVATLSSSLADFDSRIGKCEQRLAALEKKAVKV